MLKLAAKIYVYTVCIFISLAIRYARRLGRVVHYTHKGRLYMTRYALWGHLTGDGQGGWRTRLPNLYLHQMHAPDLDPALHDHPWPWAISLILLGGYCEDRANLEAPDHQLERVLTSIWNTQRLLSAPAINRLSGSTFHRIAALANEPTFTLFLAGPRAGKKSWGYLVEGRGYVSHQERHAEFDGREIREPIYKKATGKALDVLATRLGVERRKRCRWLGLLSESDGALRKRLAEVMKPKSQLEHFWSKGC